jgi:hypothetical protein
MKIITSTKELEVKIINGISLKNLGEGKEVELEK